MTRFCHWPAGFRLLLLDSDDEGWNLSAIDIFQLVSLEFGDSFRRRRIPAPAEFRHVLLESSGGRWCQNSGIKYQNLETYGGRFGLLTNSNA
jgi:hypothetical protein